MSAWLGRAVPVVSHYARDRVVRWQTGTSEGQVAVWLVLVALSTVLLVASIASYNVVPAATFVIPMLLGSSTLRFRGLAALVGVIGVFVALTVTVQSLSEGGTPPGRVSTLVTMAIIASLVLFESSRRRSGLPGPLGEAMLVELNDRLQRQGVVPQLPAGWDAQTAMLSAGGAKFAGDFLVANLSEDEKTLEMVLVDVCGKGVAAGTQSLQLAGALGGLIGSLPPLALFEAANDYLLRQAWEDGFATAVHVLVHLDSGVYSVINAGHPPALHWSRIERKWRIDDARGTALGIQHRPTFHRTEGRLEAGEALMFYTDGVVETRTHDIDEGVDWLRAVAADTVRHGFEDAARRIIAEVRTRDDDRAVLLLCRK